MATEAGWLAEIGRAWDDAQAAPDRVDAAVELLFASILQQARGLKERREALLAALPAQASGNAQSWRDIVPLASQAIVTWATGEFRLAEQAFARLAPASRRTQKDLSPHLRCVSAHALAWQAACATRTEALQRAGKLLDKAESLAAHEPWPNCRGWLHAERGRLAFWQGEITTACRRYAQAEAAFRQTQNRFALANIYEGLARIEIHQGQYRQALQQLLRAERSREMDDQLGQIKRLYHGGRIHRYQGELEEAEAHLERSLDLLIAHVSNQRWEAHVRDVLGDVYLLRGEVSKARRQFAAPVFEFDDPVFRLRRRYRGAKLAIAEAQLARNPTKRRALEQILRTCDELIGESTRQLLAEKSLRLKGAAYQLLGDPQAAAQALESAAELFAGHRANWYVSDCLHQAGCLRLEAKDVEQAAINFIRALHSAVDDRQRRTVLASLSSEFQNLDAQRICTLLTDLLQQRDKLRRERDELLAVSSAFPELIGGLTGQYFQLGGLPHIKGGLELLKCPTSRDEGEQQIRQAFDRVSQETAILREAAGELAPCTEPWAWSAAIDLCQPVLSVLAVRLDDTEWDGWGLYCQPAALRGALLTLVQFVAERGTPRMPAIQIDRRAHELHLGVTISGRRLPEACNLFAGSPSLGDFQDWNTDAKQAARLLGAVRRVQSVGSVRFDRVATARRNAAQCRYQLSVVVPVELRPSDPS